jgi:hypothetical protein
MNKEFAQADTLFWIDRNMSNIEEIDSIVNVRDPKSSSIQNHWQMMRDWRMFVDKFEVHHHTWHCRARNDPCREKYPQTTAFETRIHSYDYRFGRSAHAQSMMLPSFQIITLFRPHCRWGVIHSEQCIDRILKYSSKNPDLHLISIVYSKDRPIAENENLPCCAASRMRCAVEYFSSLCGDRRQHLSQEVELYHLQVGG